jgi:hypothetical protein
MDAVTLFLALTAPPAAAGERNSLQTIAIFALTTGA